MKEYEIDVDGKKATVGVCEDFEESVPTAQPISTQHCNSVISISFGININGLIKSEYYAENLNSFDETRALWIGHSAGQFPDQAGRLSLAATLINADTSIWDGFLDDEEWLYWLLMLFAHLRYNYENDFYDTAKIESVAHTNYEAAAHSVVDAAFSIDSMFPNLPKKGQSCKNCGSERIFLVYNEDISEEPKIYCSKCRLGFR